MQPSDLHKGHGKFTKQTIRGQTKVEKNNEAGRSSKKMLVICEMSVETTTC